MKLKRSVFLFAVLLFAIFTTGNAYSQEMIVAPKKVYKVPEENFGFIPPPVDLSHLAPTTHIFGATASSWDWRALGGVTSVKNQNPYGTCWCFAACGDLESKVLINELFTADYSELNIQACNPTSYHDCNAGGNSWISNNYLSLFGSVNETCDPYPGGCPAPTCVNPACDFFKQIREWILIPNTVTAIKNAVQTYGPVYTSFYASFAGFSSYDGTYCITYSGTESTNHAVLIVGWDDDMCSGNGAWIVKNSWGTGWGDNGYFYIQYESARIGENSSVITRYVNHDPNEKIYYKDEYGWWNTVGYGDGHDWGLLELTHTTADEYLKKVSFSATAATCTYTINVYDDFSSGTVSNLLSGPVSGAFSDAGYYTVDLSSPLLLTSGDPVYIEIELNTSPYNYPIPFDDAGTMETNKSFISSTGVSYIALDNGSAGYGDISIRGIIGPQSSSGDCSKEGLPSIQTGFPTGIQTAVRGESWCYTIEPGNAGAADTFCVDLYDTGGWDISGTPTLNSCNQIGPGGYWSQEICVYVPCSANAGDRDTIFAVMAYCDVGGLCSPECGGNDTTMVILQAADPGRGISIEQADRYYIREGVYSGLVPFGVCNPNPCASANIYSYTITSPGYSNGGCVIPLINQSGGTGSVAGGNCKNVYATVDASNACPGDTALFTIIATDGVVSDTCMQIVEIIVPSAVPLLNPVVLTVLVLVLILSAAFVMKIRAAKKI